MTGKEIELTPDPVDDRVMTNTDLLLSLSVRTQTVPDTSHIPDHPIPNDPEDEVGNKRPETSQCTTYQIWSTDRFPPRPTSTPTSSFVYANRYSVIIPGKLASHEQQQQTDGDWVSQE